MTIEDLRAPPSNRLEQLGGDLAGYSSIRVNEQWRIIFRLPTHRIASHPGQLLQKLYLDEMGISQVAFAKHLGISLRRLNEIINGKRNITPETAILLGQAFGQTPDFWLNAQMAYDLTRMRGKVRKVRPLPGVLKVRAA